MKLGIGLPLVDETVHTDFLISWSLIDKGDYTLLLPLFPSAIADIRNQLVEQAIKERCTHLIMVDTDQTFPQDTVQRLLSHNKMMVAGIVHRRYPPFEPIAMTGELDKYEHLSDNLCYSGKLIEVDAIGTGCVCYDMRVFTEEVDPPWFEAWRSEGGKWVGEDVGLCHRLRQKGVKIYADTAVQCGHITQMIVTRELYTLFRATKPGFKWSDELEMAVKTPKEVEACQSE